MRNFNVCVTTSVFLFAVGLACAQTSTASKRQLVPALPSASASSSSMQTNLPGGFRQVDQLRAMPSTIPLMANNPGGLVLGGSVATITWDISQGTNGRTWSLMVGTATSSFNGCTTIPASAVSVRCVSASVTGGGQTSAGCNVTSFTTLPNTLPGLSVGSGNEGNASLHDYTVVLSYQLADSWRFIANSCPLNLSYTVVAQ